MDLFKLVGTIAIENSEANKAIEGTTEKAEKSHGKMAVAFQNISKGMYDLCKKAGESPEPILKKYGLWTWYKND